MTTKQIQYTGAAVTALMLTAGFAFGEAKSAGKPDAAMADVMKKMEAAGAPGAAHKVLEPLVGDWAAEVKCWMAPEAPPTVTKGTARAKWVMNGRFVQEEFTGEFMGKPFRGMSLTGYDNVKKKYTTVWVDDISTAMVTSEGEGDKNGKVITLEGKCDCPITGERDKPMKQVIRLVGSDTRIFEMHDPSLGDKSKTMEITYRSTKASIAGNR